VRTSSPSRSKLADADGFFLVELLVVCVVIGVLAAIAIPSFLGNKGKADDASAKTLARTAQTAAETIAVEHSGSYTAVEPSALNDVEKTIRIAGGNGAWITAASGKANGYEVTATAPETKDTFKISNVAGVITRTCTGAGGGCPPAKTW
jgi:type IV pilus assembly protein PilA